MPEYTEVISAAKTLDGQTYFYDEKGYYQFEFGNATNAGTAAIEIDFGAGLRAVETVDLTDIDRDPFAISAKVKSAKVTPSQEMTMSVYRERV